MNNIPNEFKWEIIDKSLFDNLSLTSNIMQLSDKNVKITDELIINLIVKYFFAYRYPDSVDQKIPLSEIEDIFSIAHYYFYLSRQPDWTSIDVTNNELLESFHFIQNNLYSLAMLWDISATTVIFKDIINRVINKEIFDDNYLWVDLWTWSGVLLLAQFIQALRNDFSNVQNIWFDNETNVIKNASVYQMLCDFEIYCIEIQQKMKHMRIYLVNDL